MQHRPLLIACITLALISSALAAGIIDRLMSVPPLRKEKGCGFLQNCAGPEPGPGPPLIAPKPFVIEPLEPAAKPAAPKKRSAQWMKLHLSPSR